jgi:hypothetical protein
MSYVPGFDHDVFVSYAHGDDREWINGLINRLKATLKQRLGVEPDFWIDSEDLRRSRDFNKEIPARVKSSAVFLFFPSPSYIRSEYCVHGECRAFAETLSLKRNRFSADFANDHFAFRYVLLPVDRNEHWQLFPGLTDIRFCDDSGTFSAASADYEASFREAARGVMDLLKRMRNDSHAVFVYPTTPGPVLKEAYDKLTTELNAQNYRLLPDRQVSLPEQLHEASLSVFVLGAIYDESVNSLCEAASKAGKPWVVWCSPATRDAEPTQMGFLTKLELLDSEMKTFLNETITPSKLTEEVLALLRPNAQMVNLPSDKPRVYVVYSPRIREDKASAGQIMFNYRDEFHFNVPDDPAQHTSRLAGSDGVLVVWGKSDEDWCAREFESMMRVSQRARSRGVCLFDPESTKTGIADLFSTNFMEIHLVRQFGKFDPGRLQPFFNSIRA